jgi:hypothetical protein
MKKSNDMLRKIMLLMLAMASLLALQPYFTWSTYNGGLFSSVSKLFQVFCALFSFVIICFRNFTKSQRKYYIPAIITLFIFLLIGVIFGDYNIAGKIYWISIGLCSAIIVCLSDDEKAAIMNLFITLFVLCLIPGLVIYVFNSFNVILPYVKLTSENSLKEALGHYYKQYLGSVFLFTSSDAYCAVFDEPGIVGTFSALLLVSKDMKITKDWRCIILLLAGIASKSFAFLMIVMIAIILKYIHQKAWKVIIYFSVSLIAFFIFMNINTDNMWITTMQRRLTIADGRWMGDNRSNNVMFDTEYNNFIHSDIETVLFGNGNNAASRNPNMTGSSEYRMLIYDYGFIGFFGIISWLILSIYFMYRKKSRLQWNIIILLVVFIASMYQRPYIFNEAYVLILFGGSALLQNSKTGLSYRVTTNVKLPVIRRISNGL